MIAAALYVDKDSILHRLAPAWKLIGLPVVATALFATSNLPVIAVSLLVVIGLYAMARIPWRTALAQLRVVAAVLVLLFVVQLWLAGPTVAGVTSLRFLALILAASLVTLTTRTSDMIEALEAKLSYLAFLGVDAAKVSLAISLVIRFVPVIGAVLADLSEAQAARGGTGGIYRLAVPLVVRTLKMADEIAEAIDARS